MLRNFLAVSLSLSLAVPASLPQVIAETSLASALLDDTNDAAAVKPAPVAPVAPAAVAPASEPAKTEPVKPDDAKPAPAAEAPAQPAPVEFEPVKPAATTDKEKETPKAEPVKPAVTAPVEPKPTDTKAGDAKTTDTKTTETKTDSKLDKKARNIRLQFDGIPMADVVRRFSQMSQRPMIGELKIDGTLTFFDAEPYDYYEALDTLNMILLMRNYMLVEDGRFLRLVSASELGTQKIQILSGIEEADEKAVRPGEVITVVLPVLHMDVESASKAIVPMVSTFGRIAPLARGKGILLTDTYSNIKRVRQLIALMDQKADEETNLSLKSYQLKRAGAANAANVVNNLLRSGGSRRSSEGGERSSAPTTSRAGESVLFASYDERSNILLLRGTKDLLELADQLVLMLDAENPDAGDPVRTFGLKTAGAKDVAAAIMAIVGTGRGSSSSSSSRPVYVYGDSTMNSVLVRAGIEDMPMIEKLIKELDGAVKDLNGVRAFPLKATQAVSIVEVLRAVLTPRTTDGARTLGGIAVTADPNTNVLYVSGTPTILENAAKIIADIDKTIDEDVKEVHVVQLGDADAASSAATLMQMFQQKNPKASAAVLPMIMPIAASNSLVVSSTPAQWNEIKKLLEQIKGAMVATNAPMTRIITLKHAKSVELAETLSQVFVHGGNGAATSAASRRYSSRRTIEGAAPVAVTAPVAAEAAAIIITASERNNSLIISAIEADQLKIAEMITMLDVEATAKVDPIQIVTLKSADATKVAQTLNEMLAKDPAMKDNPVAVTADAATNTVLVRAAESQRKMVETLIASLDEKTLTNAREQRSIVVQHVSASALVPMLTQLNLPAGTAKAADPTERVVIAAAPGDRMLIVDAPKQKIDQIAQLIASMDKADGTATQQIRTYPLTKSNAKELAATLSRMFPEDPKALPGAELAPRFDADTGSNQLIASATATQFEKIEKVIKEVMETLDSVTVTRTYRLKHAKAAEVVPVIESMLLDAPVGPLAAKAKEGASVRVAALVATNDIIVQGPADKLSLAAELIKTFDDPEATKNAVIQVVQLKNAQATSMATAVNSIFAAKKAAGPAAAAAEEVMSVTAEPNSNSVLVRGPVADVAEAIKLINRLDSESKPGSTQMKIYRLKNGDAAALSKTVEGLFRSVIAQQNDKVKGIEPPPFSVGADERTNSLVISTTASYFALVEELLSQLDEPQPERQAEYFALVNADADSVAAQLEELFVDRKTDKPVIQPDFLAGSVTVIAKEADMKTISQLITKIDAAQVEDTSRQFVVVPMQKQSAKKMAEMLKNVYQQTSGGKVIVTDQVPGTPGASDGAPSTPAPAPQPKEDGKPGARLDSPMDMNGLALDVAQELAAGVDAQFITAQADPDVKTIVLPDPKAGEPVPDVIIAVDEATNSLIISGTRKQISEVQSLITKFSDPEATEADMDFRVFTVKHSDPEVLTQILNSLFNPRVLQQQQLQSGSAAQQQLFQLMQQQLGGQIPGLNLGIENGGRATRGRAGEAVVPAQGSTRGTTNQRGQAQQQQQTPPTVILVADRRTNRVIARGKPADLDLVEQVVKQIDTSTTLASEVRVFVLKNTDSREVASNLNEMFVARRTATSSTARGILIQSKLEQKIQEATGSKEPVDMASVLSIGSNSQTNSVIVAAPGAAMGIIAEIISELDQSAASSVPSIRMYPIKHSDLTSTVTNLRQVFAPLMAGAGANGAGRVVITADAGANTIIVSASPDQHAMISQVIGEIEKSQPGDELLIKVYRINNAEATSIANTLTTMLSSSGQGGLSTANNAALQLLRNPRGGGTTVAPGAAPSAAASAALRITADSSSNSLVVRATKEEHEQIKKLIDEIDVAIASAQPVQLIPLKNADATNVAQALSRVFAGQQQGNVNAAFRGLNNQRQPVVIEGDRDSKMLMVRADEKSFEKIKEMAMQLDVASPAGMLSQRVVQLEHAQAQSIATALSEAFAPQQSGGGTAASRLTGGATTDAGQRVLVVAEPVSNSVIVTASEDNHVKVMALIEKLDTAKRGGLQNEFLVLKNATASDMATALQKIASGNATASARGSRGAAVETTTVSADPSTNALIFSGPATEVARIRKMASDLDIAKGADDTGIAIIPIKNGDAATIAATVNDLFRQTAISTLGKGGSATKFAVSADARSNSVIIVGSPDIQTQLRFTIAHLELITPERGKLRVVNLQHADPSEFQRVIYSIYGGTPDAARSQQGGNQGTNQGNGNTGNQGGNTGNRNSPNQGVQPGGGQGFQPGGGQRGGGQRGGGQGQPRSDAGGGSTSTSATTETGRVTATPLPQQKSILINSNDEDYDAIMKLAAAMDEAAKASKRQAKVIILQNANNTRLATTLNQMYLQAQVGAAGANQQEERVTVAALAGTQAIIVTASPTKMPEVEAMITTLDNPNVNPQVDFKVFAIKNTTPTKVLPTLKLLMAKVETIPQDPAADVQAEERTRSLIVTGKTNSIDEVARMIALLDVAPAYESAQILIVQLKRSDATRMATVLNSMLRPADAAVVTAEARALQEHVRLLKVMDDKGERQIELDLTKPIKITADPLQAGDTGGNQLLLSSTPDNLKSLAALIELMDRVPLTDALKIQLVNLETADAVAVARTLTEIFTQGQKLGGKAGTPVAGKAEPEAVEGKALVNQLNVSADERTNSLVISGREESVALAMQITKDLDRDASKFVTEVKLFPLKHARASTLAPMLSEVFAEQQQGGGANTSGIEGVKTQVTRLRKVLPDGKTVDSETAKSRAALTIRADDTTQTLVVAARSDVLPLIEDVIKTLDIPSAGAGNLVRFLPLENADATRLKTVIDSLYTGANAKDVREVDIPTVAVDTRTNALIISASDKTFIMIDAMTRQLDRKTPVEIKEIKLIKLKNAEATALAPTLQKAMDDRVARQTSLGIKDAESLKMMVVADARSNSLIVGGSPEGFLLLESIATQIDEAGPALSGQIQLIALKEANAGTLAATLQQLFDQRYAAAATPDVQRQKPIILPELRSNSLVVAANADDSKVLTGLLAKMDIKLTDPAVGLFVVGMKHNDAGIVGPSVQRLMQARMTANTVQGQTPAPQDQVNIETDSLSNALIISASKENLALIQNLLTKVDVEPPTQTGVVRMYTLTNSDATRVSEMLKSLATQGFVKPGAPTTTGQNQVAAARDKVSIEVDSRTNVLIVSASKENFAVIDEIVKQIDSGKDFGLLGDVRMYVVQHADPTRLAPTLQEFFDKKKTAETTASPDGAAARALTVSIVPDARTKTLLVAGSKESFAAVESMLKQLDVPGGTNASEFRVFQLKAATASAIQPVLKNLFDTRNVQGTNKDVVTVLADSRSNALIVGARTEDMAIVERLIEQLDTKPKDQSATLKLFALQKANALEVAATLRGVFAESSGVTGATQGATGGTGANATTGITSGVSINVDERINAIIVSAGAADLERIGNLVKQLDTHTPTKVTEIRVFTLTNANSTELAVILNDMLTKTPMDPRGGTGTGTAAASGRSQVLLQVGGNDADRNRVSTNQEKLTQAVQEGVIISADRRTNSLVVSAPLDYMMLVSQLIRSLDQPNARKAEIQLFQLKNADAQQLATVLATVFKLQATGGTAANGTAIEYVYAAGRQDVSTNGQPTSATVGTAEQDALSVTVDTRTNSLVVGGSQKHVALVGEVISSLDESPAQERKTEIFRLRNGQAQDIQTSISTFLDQERQRLTATLGADKIGAAQRLAEQDVSIVAEITSNSLIISASPRHFDKIRAMINKLDDPKPQVLIQVLLAEVTLDDGTDLGFEWQYTGKIGNNEITAGTDFGIQQAFNQFGGLGVAVTGGDLTFFLRALQSQGKLEVLSRPQILASDNQPANINVGQRVPFVTNSNVSDNGNVTNTIQYQDVGILLNVVARISDDGFVNMDVRPEVSSLSTSAVQVSEAVSAPIINNRSAETKVTVQDGHTIVVGGLITSSDEHREDKVPILGDIPLLGEVFKSTTKRKNRTELLIILTPRVLYKPEDAAEITKIEKERLEMMKKLKLEDAGKAIDIPFNGNGPLRERETPAVPQPNAGTGVKRPAAPADFGASVPSGKSQTSATKLYDVAGKR